MKSSVNWDAEVVHLVRCDLYVYATALRRIFAALGLEESE